TFVALGAAYSILSALRDSGKDGDLKDCSQKILVLVPSNTLVVKWQQEVDEFAKRCIPEATCSRVKPESWFRARRCEHIDDVAASMPLTGTRILIMSTGGFG